jgi:PAS domain S-box-containing protein
VRDAHRGWGLRSLRGYLAVMATLLVLLVCGATAIGIWQLDASSRQQTSVQLLNTSRAMSLAVDGRVQTYAATLMALRQSEAVKRRDWRAVDAEARTLLAGPDAWIVVGDRHRHQLVNTRLPPGAALPSGRDAPEMWPALDRGDMHVCNLAQGYVAANILCVDVPIMEDGRAAYHLSAIFTARSMRDVMNPERIGGGRILTVLDRTGRIAWRNRNAEHLVGRLASAELRTAIASQGDGFRKSVTLDGLPVVVAFSRSPLSGWTFLVSLPQDEIAADARHALIYGGAAGLILLLVGASVGALAGRRVASAVDRLNAAASRVAAGGQPAFEPSGLEEIDAAGAALEAAIAARDVSQERFALAQEVGGIGAWEWDARRDEGHVTDSYKAMHGLTHVAGPLRLAQVLAMIHPDDLPGYRQRLAAATLQAAPSTNEYRVVHADGAIRWIFAKGRPLFDAAGERTGAVGIVMDITERKAAEERLQLLMREVDHRANNLMAVIQGAVSLSRAEDPKRLQEIIVGRVQALARAHQLLAASRWAGADLRRLVEEEMAPYTLGEAGRVGIVGDSLSLSPGAAQGLAMGLHELATNAAKHGALSTAQGQVSIRWRVIAGRLHLHWQESGGPPVTAPDRKGFGTTVLQRALSGAVGGTTRLDWRSDGLVCDFELPLEPAPPTDPDMWAPALAI